MQASVLLQQAKQVNRLQERQNPLGFAAFIFTPACLLAD
jgi:hypothetical protein